MAEKQHKRLGRPPVNPGGGPTKVLAIRFPEGLVNDALMWASVNGTSVTAIVVDLLRGYMEERKGQVQAIKDVVKKKGAEPPAPAGEN